MPKVITCPECEGKGKCKWCTPKFSGSGKNSDGSECAVCHGTGECWYEHEKNIRCQGGTITIWSDS